MPNEVIITIKNVTKTYPLYNSHADRVKETFHPFRKKYHRSFNALTNISFEVRSGETFGVIGRNGSGKSTLLQVLCGILRPTSGTVEVKGRISSLLELGAGFNPEFTGRQNVYMNGAIIGLKNEEIEARFDEIEAFADIGEFIDQPVKTYSSGMFVRLAFAVQACTEPDVLIVDEILSVGDIFFQQKCHARMEELQRAGTSIVIVSHDMTAMQKYTNQTMVLDQGRCFFWGSPSEAVQRYYHIDHQRVDYDSAKMISNTFIDEWGSEGDSTTLDIEGISDWPSEKAFLDLSKAVVIGHEDLARCTKIAVCDVEGNPRTTFEIGEVACFFYEFELLKDIEVPLGGLEIYNRFNIPIYAKASIHFLLKAPAFSRKGTRLRFRQSVELSVMRDEYTFVIALASMSAQTYVNATEMRHEQILESLQMAMRITQIGFISVQGRKKGHAVPFTGLVDLKGDCVMTVVNKNNDKKKEFVRPHQGEN
jgi:ABC-type polysaccharide/polyol phosphate transport system ATPase subunit